MDTKPLTSVDKPGSKVALVAALSAVGSVVAALTCCLPVLPFVLAAGTASSASLLGRYAGALRPYLLSVSVLFIAIGFYQSRRAIQCRCKPTVLSQVILWLSALIVAVSILLRH